MREKSDWRSGMVAASVVAAAFVWSFGRQASEPIAPAAEPARPGEGQAAALPMDLFGAVGKEARLLPGQELTLLQQGGDGTLTHLWFGGSRPGWGNTRVRVYVDGEKKAGIDMALFLGHGVGWGDDAAPWGNNRIGKTGRPSGVYDTYKIPFGKSVRVTAELAPEVRHPQTFWYVVRGVTHYPLQVGGISLPPAARLRLHCREMVEAEPLEEVEILDTQHKGLLYAVTLAAASGNYNYLEGCLRAFPDGRKDPVWLSSGTEDYFLGTYYFNAGPYHLPIAGATHIDPDKAGSSYRFSAYRFHEDDPIPFRSGLRLTWRNGEEIGGHRFGDPRATTVTSYVWTFEW